MADSSLDDFFAKKDKSKKSKKFTTTDQIAKKLEEGGKKPEKPTRKDKEKTVNSSSSVASTFMQNPEQEEDEWREFEEKETDYSGLKIQNLQISDLRDEEAEKERLEEQSEEDRLGQKDSFGPWNKSAVQPEVKEVPEPVKEKEETTSGGKYVAPHARSSGASSGTKTKSKAAPEISSELHFPSLSSSADGLKKGDRSLDIDRGFESVKRGASRPVEEAGNKGPKLDLGNKFDALSQGESS